MPQTLEQALESFDRQAGANRQAKAEHARRDIVRLFPIEGWPTLTLERYALGQEDSSDTFCRWVEFRSPDLGSISGGSSIKHIIYKHRTKAGWYFPQQFAHEHEAWQRLRADVVIMLQRARDGQWEDLPELLPFQYGPALWIKTLHIYFPEEVLSVCSRDHLSHFWYRLTGEEPRVSRKVPPILLNRQLLQALRSRPALAGLSSNELSYFLYHWDDPRAGSSVYKIAPGEDAKLWDECLRGGYVCVGWPAVGDLKAFEDFGAFAERFQAEYARSYGDTPAGKATLTRKGKELWRLMDIQPGDRIVANKGVSQILGIGEVQDPPYEWAGEQAPYPHHIRVNWDTSQARSIPPQQKWAFATIAPVPLEQYERLLSADATSPATGAGATSITLVSDPELAQLGERLEERKQLILYGPPGTGKTYTARRFLLHWLLTAEGHPAAETLADRHRTAVEWNRLTQPDAQRAAQVTLITFHPSYSYEDFVEGFRPVPSQDSGLRLAIEDGVFKRVCKSAADRPDRRFVLLIDEINRGNLPRIFGELITVLEADKRGLSVLLPQSKEMFVVPDNVFIVGTMNTADRSIKVLDAAIRRRFAFHELMPDTGLLAGRQFGDLVLEDLLDFLNGRISKKEGREKQIGHAVFIDGDEPVADLEEFAKRFRYEVIPLLQEYCYEDYRSLAEYLGSELVDVEAQRLRADVLSQPETMAAALARLINGADAL